MALIFQFSNHDHPNVLFDVKYLVHLMKCRKDTHELTSHEREISIHTVAYLLKAKTVEPEKQPLLGNAPTQQQRNYKDTRCKAYSRCYGAIG
jgi:hypothetical protein